MIDRLGLLFGISLLLLATLLGYYWLNSWSEEKTLLVERIEADLNQELGNELSLMLERTNLRAKREVSADTGAANIDFRINAIDVITPTADTAKVKNGPSSITFYLDRSYQEASSVFIFPSIENLSSRIKDSIAAANNVELFSFPAEDSLLYQSALRVDASMNTRSKLGPPAKTLYAIKNYRRTLLSRIFPEMGFGALLFLAVVLAFYTAYRNLVEHRQQIRDKDVLLANIAHELKTPIATVGVALEALRNFGADAQPERRREYIDISKSELNRLDLMADRAIDSLRAGDLAARLQPVRVDLAGLTREAWRGLHLRYGLSPDLIKLEINDPATLTGDRHYLYLAIYNLLDNAVKYGGSPPQITIEIWNDDGFLDFTVIDNGKGIPHAERERIFERFYRGQQEGHEVKGHGLGLSFVREVARAHGGRTMAGTHPSGGGWVSLTLPYDGRA